MFKPPKKKNKKDLNEKIQGLEETDSETVLGHQPASGSDEVTDIDEIAKSMGIYDEETNEPENLTEVSIADEIEKNREG